MSLYIRGKTKALPVELAEVAMLHAAHVPIASSYIDLMDVPARLMQDHLILQGGIADAEETMRMEAELASKR